ncbi:MAG: PEPxxWA-CTERM sorting domain-containing protein [Phenylobacterium sp.]|nr:PEPxxWA-CTERM sorting domain-containing protein [Phenylobacterium sp.]
MRHLMIAAAALALVPAAAQATILTFDIADGVSNFENMPQTYGDNVSAAIDGLGHSYGVGAEGYTPNVTVDYGTPGEDPALWTTGYGDLTNIYFNDADGDLTFTTTFTADAGFLVDLYSFDMAWYFASPQTIAGLSIVDVAQNQVLYSQGPFVLPGGEAHTPFTFATPLSASTLRIVVDLTGLGGVSDDVALDNIRFGQSQAPVVGGIPEPSTWAMMILGFGAAGTMLRGARRRETLGAA